MNWSNVNLESTYETQQTFLDGYSFETLLLELDCNFRIEDITREKVLEYVKKEIQIKMQASMEVIDSNIDNIIKKAIKEKKNV